MDIFIDIMTGTWGYAGDLVVVRNLSREQLDALDEMGDHDIVQFGCDNGTPLPEEEP